MKKYFHAIKQAVLSVLGVAELPTVAAPVEEVFVPVDPATEQAEAVFQDAYIKKFTIDTQTLSPQDAEAQVAQLIADYKDEVGFNEDGSVTIPSVTPITYEKEYWFPVDAAGVAVTAPVSPSIATGPTPEPAISTLVATGPAQEPVISTLLAVNITPVPSEVEKPKTKRAPRKKKFATEEAVLVVAAPQETPQDLTPATEEVKAAPKKRNRKKK